MTIETISRPSRASIIKRLVAALTGLVVLFWLIAVGLGAYVMNREFAEIFDGTLQETAERLMPLILDDLAQRDGNTSDQNLQMDKGLNKEYLTLQLLDASGKVIMRSQDAPEAPYEVPLQVGFHNTAKYKIYTASAMNGTLFLHVADAYRNRREALREGTVALLWPLALLIPASILLIQLIVRRSLSPLDRLRDEIGTKDSGNLAAVEHDTLPRELRPIARSVNLLLGRLRSALEAEREFTANSAHELRTPIAGALAQTQRLIEELPPGPHAARAGLIEIALTNLGRLSEKLLQLSRAEAGIGTAERQIDVIGVINAVVTDYDRDTRTAGRVSRDYTTDTQLLKTVDMDAFAIVMRNLLENALVHGADDGAVSVGIEGNVIRVVNGGSIVPPEELANLKRRFRRGETKASGSGLGLAIAEKIVTQMGGRLDLVSPARGLEDGFEARIVLDA